MMEETDKLSDYEDIIYLPVPKIWVRPRMSRSNRAVQFAPFAALSGFDALVKETAKQIKEK